jgi:hypothetical protein
VVFDHFESFAYSQDYPIGIGTPVGKDSWFVYGIEAATRRRGGKLSPAQKARRKALKTSAYAKPGAYGRSVRETLTRPEVRLLTNPDRCRRGTHGGSASPIPEQFPKTIGAG